MRSNSAVSKTELENITAALNACDADDVDFRLYCPLVCAMMLHRRELLLDAWRLAKSREIYESSRKENYGS